MIIYDDENHAMTILAAASVYHNTYVKLSDSREQDVVERLSASEIVIWLTHHSRCVQFSPNQQVIIFNHSDNKVDLFGFLNPEKVKIVNANELVDVLGINMLWLIIVDSILSQYPEYSRITIDSMDTVPDCNDVVILILALLTSEEFTAENIKKKSRMIGLLSEYANSIGNMIKYVSSNPDKIRDILYKQSLMSKCVTDESADAENI